MFFRQRTFGASGHLRGLWRLWFAAVILLTACGKEPAGRTTITFWHFWPRAVIQPVLDEFEQLHPEWRVESQQLTWQSGFEKIVLAFASHTTPDLCELGSTWVARFAADGVLSDLERSPDEVRESYFLSGPGVYKEQVFALPWLVGTRALFFNRQLFREAGLDPDSPPETWQDLLAAARRVDALSPGVHGFGTNSGERHVLYKKFLPFAWSNGGRLLSEDGSTVLLDSPENLEALRFFLTLAQVSLVEKQAVLDQVFKEGRIGLMISGSWNLKSIPREVPALEFGVALVPKPDEGEHVSFGGAEMLVIPKGSKSEEGALFLAEFLIRPEPAWRIAGEVQSVWPAARNARDQAPALSPEAQVFMSQMETARTVPTEPRWVEIEEIIDIHLERALYGRASAADALRDAQREIQAVLKR